MEGSAIMLVTECGEDSVLGKIVSTVQEAQSSKVPIQEVADRVAAVFVPVVAFLSFSTFLVWFISCMMGVVPQDWLAKSEGNPALFSFLFALAVWVSACPCAFGLATPTAILVSTGVAASHGILIRRGAGLQYAASVNVIAFDKTGTLTKGNTSVTDLLWLNSNNNEFKSRDKNVEHSYTRMEQITLLRVLSLAESTSAHPISKGNLFTLSIVLLHYEFT